MSDATNFVANKVLYRHNEWALLWSIYLFLFLATRWNSYVRQGVSHAIFSAKMLFSYFRPALEPEILCSQVRTGNCCRVIVIMHPGFVQFFGQYTYLWNKNISIRTLADLVLTATLLKIFDDIQRIDSSLIPLVRTNSPSVIVQHFSTFALREKLFV